MPVEPLELRKKIDLFEISVQNAHGIAGIISANELVSGIVDGLQMARRNVPGCADQCKVFHEMITLSSLKK